MSLHCPEPNRLSRRAWLRWAAAASAAPLLARAACPCGGDKKDDQKQNAAAAPATRPLTALRVCADPHNLPYSNRKHEGFEDRIAALVARDLGLTLEYEWLPQRLGFYRTALKTFDSNLVMAAPAGFEKALTSDPYYRSTYVFVYRKNGTPIKSFEDAALRSAKIGVQLTSGSNTPPTHALVKRKLIDNVTGYPVFDETEGKPGEKIIAAVANGEIDVAIAWGPQAGYFAKRQSVPLEVTPVAPQEDAQGEARIPFTFEICMALRRPDKELREKINQVIANRRSEIDQILDDYDVPRLAIQTGVAGTQFDRFDRHVEQKRRD